MAAYLVVEVHPLMRMAVLLYLAGTAPSLDHIVPLAALPAAVAKLSIRMDRELAVEPNLV
jgi:hypothetical protein